MKATSKKQHRSFVENSMHKVNFCTFKSAAKVLKVLLATGLQKKKMFSIIILFPLLKLKTEAVFDFSGDHSVYIHKPNLLLTNRMRNNLLISRL